MEEIAARNIRNQLVKYVSPVLKSLRDPPDNIEEYRALYGSLGPYLQQGVVRARQQSGGRSGSSSSAGPAAGARRQLSPSTVVVPGRVYLISPGAVRCIDINKCTTETRTKFSLLSTQFHDTL